MRQYIKLLLTLSQFSEALNIHNSAHHQEKLFNLGYQFYIATAFGD
jgi:hypothetical protein